MCAVHVTILGLLARLSDFYAEQGSEVRALKSADGPNPNFAPNIYIRVPPLTKLNTSMELRLGCMEVRPTFYNKYFSAIFDVGFI